MGDRQQDHHVNKQEAAELHAALRPDVCTLDLVMPEFDGLYALRAIRAADADAKVVLVSAVERRQPFKRQ